MKLNCFLFLVGLILPASADFSLAKNTEDVDVSSSKTSKLIRDTTPSIKSRSLESKHVVIPYHGDGEGNRNRELLGDADHRFLADVTLNFGPGGKCYVCGSRDFQCSDNAFNYWNNGERDFTDPLNTSVDSMKVEVFGLSCGSVPIEVSLNGNVLGQLSSLSDYCSCGDCYSSSNTFEFNPAIYNVGGSNTIKLISGRAICVDRVELDLFTPTTLFTSNNLKIVFSGFASGVDLASLFRGLSIFTEEAIHDALFAEGVAIDINDISISSSIVSISARNLLENESRSLQGTSGIQQDVNVNAPASAINIGTINGNIATRIAASTLQGVSSQASIVYEEPPWPCNGVTCSNAGKCEVLSHTEAICRCENTFVPSESGLECICPDGLDFHSNVNRCLPPPTAAPTNLPTKSPTLVPTASPTETVINEEEDTPSCVDDMSGTFKLFNIMEEVKCDWLTRNKDKTTYRKNKYCVIDEVKSLCQSTCGACTGCDDKEGTFTLLNVKKRETCAWLTKNKLNAEARKDAYCVLDEVRDMCKASCGTCAVEDESGRV